MTPDKERLAVLKLAGYEIEQVVVRKHLHQPSWDWDLVIDGNYVETSVMYHQTKAEAITDAWLTMLDRAERTNTPKERIVCPK